MEQKKILITEDEEPISQLLSYTLNKEGFVTQVAKNGQECLSYLDSFKPDLMILDLMLPDMSGFDICKEVAAKYFLPTIIITAKSDSVDKILGMELGADDYITKPFNTGSDSKNKSSFRRISLIEDKENQQQTVLLNWTMAL